MPELDYKHKYDDVPSMINLKKGLLILDDVLFSNGSLRHDWILMTSILNEGQRHSKTGREGERGGGGSDSRVTDWCCYEQIFYKDLDFKGNVLTLHYKCADV